MPNSLYSRVRLIKKSLFYKIHLEHLYYLTESYNATVAHMQNGVVHGRTKMCMCASERFLNSKSKELVCKWTNNNVHMHTFVKRYSFVFAHVAANTQPMFPYAIFLCLAVVCKCVFIFFVLFTSSLVCSLLKLLFSLLYIITVICVVCSLSSLITAFLFLLDSQYLHKF